MKRKRKLTNSSKVLINILIFLNNVAKEIYNYKAKGLLKILWLFIENNPRYFGFVLKTFLIFNL